MLKKLLVWAAVLLIAALLAAPALAIEAMTPEAAANTESPTGAFTAEDCPTLQQDPAVWEANLAMFPDLATLCG